LGENPQENLDLSEVGNSWFIHTSVPDESSPFYGDYLVDENKGAKGGSYQIAAQGLASGFGTYPEELMPYKNWGYPYSESLRIYSDYRLKEQVVLPNDVSLIKNRIMEYGSVYVSFISYNGNYYYNDEMMESYFDNGSAIKPSDEVDPGSHAVSIVGWDDNYSRENFNPLMRPENDGAWLCKNSWGENFGSKAEGYEGFFWISYECYVNSLAQFVMQSAEEFDNIYQHQYTSEGELSLKTAANVFTAESNEILEQICYFSSGAEGAVTVEIYKLDENYTTPEDGVLLSSFDASAEFPGAHTFEVPEEVEINAGDEFSVVVKSDEHFYLSFRYADECEENKSFYVYEDMFEEDAEGEWRDIADSYLGYFAIKAYTSNKDDVVYKDKLEKAINNAETYKANEKISQKLLSCLNDAILTAKEVLNDPSATQNKVNNATYVLGGVVDDCKYSYFEINSMDDFMNLIDYSKSGLYNEAEIVLNTDLDFSSYPIVTSLYTDNVFNGYFNGNGHTISNLNNNRYKNSGLFFMVENAVIENVELKNCSFNSALNTGTIVGHAVNSTISNCTVTGATVINNQDYAGGIAGFGEDVVISNCNVKDSNIKSSSEIASGILGSCFGADINNCSISNTEILGYSFANLYSAQDVSNCSYDNVTVKSLNGISISENKTLYNNTYSENCHAFFVFENGKFTIQPLIGEISGVSSDEATVTKVDKYYEVEINEGFGSAYINIEYLPLNTNNFTYTYDFVTNTITLDGYNNDTDETITEVVFPSHIGTIPVTFVSYLFKFNSIAPVKSIVLPETIDTINGNIFSTCYDLEKVTIPASITTVETGAFSECSMLTDVYYGGTQEQWNEIMIGVNNDNLLNANIHFTDAPLEYEVGDVNRDGDINIKDATIVQEYVAKYVVLDETQLILADVNMDNDVNIKDATYIQEIVAKLV
ncbi:MAG: leucine-rich repeat protein, partial [Ruminococcus sp.]|nr:leucine-rich repeat protein [Ruminococcus sp.]